MVLALAAGCTETALLGTAVVPTFPSHPLVTARAVQTAAAAAPGRIVLGVGAGHRTWVEHEHRQRFDRPVALEQAGVPAAIVGSPGKFLKHKWSVTMSVQHKQPEKGRFLRSGEVASASGVNFQTLRYYERRELLATPERNGSGHRLYPPHTVTLLRTIKGAQRLGLSLDEIASVIASDDTAASIAALAKRRVVEIDAKSQNSERPAMHSQLHRAYPDTPKSSSPRSLVRGHVVTPGQVLRYRMAEQWTLNAARLTRFSCRSPAR